MHNLDLFRLHEVGEVEKERLKMSQMLCGRIIDVDMSEDSDEERDTRHNLLDAEDGIAGNEMIEEEDEGNECDE
jgi:hypothetical protein